MGEKSEKPDTLELLLARWSEGDNAAGERVFALAYNELRRVAANHFRRERPGHTLQPTALVNEVFLKLSNGRPVQWQNREHFFAVFSKKVRLVLVDHARKRRAQKRQDTLISPGLAAGRGHSGPHYESLLSIDRILSDLEKLEPRLVQVAEMRIFGGLKDPEIASALDISLATVKRDWTAVRAWLVSRFEEQ